MPSLIMKNGVLRYRASVPIPGKPGKRKQKLYPDDSKKTYKKTVLWEEETKKQLKEEMKQEAVMASFNLGVLCDLYLDDVKNRCVKKTYQEKCAAFSRLFEYEPIDSAMPVSELVESKLSETSLARDFLNFQFENRGGNAANKDRKNLSTAWNWGQTTLRDFPKNLINPFYSVERYPKVSCPRYVPSEDDFWKVYDVAEGQDKVMLLFSYHLAARRGETFRAKKSDIDFKNEKISLWTRKRKGGNLEFDWMPMTQKLKTALLPWLEVRMSQPTIDTENIFVCLDKTPFCDQYYGKPFKSRQHFMRRICKKAKVKPFGFHAIRHLAATVHYHKGKPLNWLQRFLRHKNPSTTEKYLKSIRLEHLREGLDEGLIRPGEVFEFKKEKAPETISSGGQKVSGRVSGLYEKRLQNVTY
jgi:integrase